VSGTTVHAKTRREPTGLGDGWQNDEGGRDETGAGLALLALVWILQLTRKRAASRL